MKVKFNIQIEVDVERLKLCRGEVLMEDELLQEALIQEFDWLNDSGIKLTKLKREERK